MTKTNRYTTHSLICPAWRDGPQTAAGENSWVPPVVYKRRMILSWTKRGNSRSHEERRSIFSLDWPETTWFLCSFQGGSLGKWDCYSWAVDPTGLSVPVCVCVCAWGGYSGLSLLSRVRGSRQVKPYLATEPTRQRQRGPNTSAVRKRRTQAFQQLTSHWVSLGFIVCACVIVSQVDRGSGGELKATMGLNW